MNFSITYITLLNLLHRCYFNKGGGRTKLHTYFWSKVWDQKRSQEQSFRGCFGDHMDVFWPSFDPPPETLSFPRVYPLKIPWLTSMVQYMSYMAPSRPKMYWKWGFSTIFGLFRPPRCQETSGALRTQRPWSFLAHGRPE